MKDVVQTPVFIDALRTTEIILRALPNLPKSDKYTIGADIRGFCNKLMLSICDGYESYSVSEKMTSYRHAYRMARALDIEMLRLDVRGLIANKKKAEIDLSLKNVKEQIRSMMNSLRTSCETEHLGTKKGGQDGEAR